MQKCASSNEHRRGPVCLWRVGGGRGGVKQSAKHEMNDGKGYAVGSKSAIHFCHRGEGRGGAKKCCNSHYIWLRNTCLKPISSTTVQLN